MTGRSEPEASYWDVLEPVWERIDIYRGPARFLQTYSEVDEVPRTLFAVHFCQSEVCNGGFHQFFWNATGVLAPEAAEGFGRIGLPQAESLLRKAMSFFGNTYPREREVRVETLDEISGRSRREWDPFYDLDDVFYALLRQYPFEGFADVYAMSKGRSLERH